MGRRKWTHERFWEEYNKLEDKNLYTVIELPEKLSTKVKVSFRCNEGHNFATTINNFLNNKTRCFTCAHGKKWTHEKFWELYNELPDRELYEVIELPENLSARTKVTFRCKENHKFSMKIANFFYRGQRCFVCAHGERWQLPRFFREIELLEDKDNYIFENYDNITSIESIFSFTCRHCDSTFSTNIRSFFKDKKRCTNCKKRKYPGCWSTERFLREIELLPDKNEYVFTDYNHIIRNTSKFTVFCHKCKHVWSVTCRSFFNSKSRCPNCANGLRWNNERVIREFQETADYNKFTLLLTEKVVNDRSKFSVQCQKGHVWKVSPNDYFSGGKRCPVCNESRGEKTVSLFLERNNINFQRQKTFDNCRYIKKLRFDFYLPYYLFLLEINGEQHYIPVCFGSDKNADRAKERLITIQKRDAIKKQWAIDNGYRFLEIRYDEINNIEEILKKELRL